MKKWIQEKGTLITQQPDYSALNGTSFNGVAYDDVIFCEGYLGKENPWFGSLPLNQTKGETLTIKSDGIPEDESVNRKCFILPLGNQQFKVGSTYEWHTSTLNTTEKGREEILEKAAYLTNAKIEVIDQAVGIRPTVIDRRPLIGTHPEHKNYHIFNGLGTKGYMLAPTLSREFIAYLLDGTALDAEVNIDRFASNKLP
jgi:glycine/D-amino acid oxidase-like deaminating enzyme